MKSLALFLILGVAAHATPYVFTLTGDVAQTSGTAPLPVGTSFTATITIDPTLTDSHPGNPTQGNYFHPVTSSLIEFSNGLSFSNLPLDYAVANNYHLSAPGLETDYDAIAFYFSQPTFTLGFEIRLALDAFDNDFALTPTLSPIIPTGNAELPYPTNWFYYRWDVWGFAGGAIDSIDGRPASVPELPNTLALLFLPLAVLALAHRSRGIAGSRNR